MMTIAVDAMGGDAGPSVVFQSLSKALKAFVDLSFRVYCSPAAYDAAPMVVKHHRRLRWVLTKLFVSQDDWPATALKRKQYSTMGLALRDLAAGKVDAVVTSGNTGALVAMSKYFLGLLPGLDRPALGTWLPDSKGGSHLLLDIGANVECNSERLVQFALIGSAVVEQRLNIATPKVALLNVGTELHKGGERLQTSSDALMRADSGVNFCGFIEGNDLFSNQADVIVCDGFVGNISVKACEGLLDYLQQTLGLSVMRGGTGSNFNLRQKLLTYLLRPVLAPIDDLRMQGSVLLGLTRPVVKCHGRSDQGEWFKALKYVCQEVRSETAKKVAKRLGVV